MSYSTRKGYDGEVEFAEFLTDAMRPYGINFLRIGGTERGKKTLVGDVIVDKRTDPDGNCFLDKYFLESKRHASPVISNILEEAEANARMYGKASSICYITKQKAGSKRDWTLIAMTPSTFARIATELQGYRNAEAIDKLVK